MIKSMSFNAKLILDKNLKILDKIRAIHPYFRKVHLKKGYGVSQGNYDLCLVWPNSDKVAP